MLHEFLLRGHHVIRRDHDNRIHIQGLRLKRQRDRISRGDAPHVGVHRNPPCDRLFAKSHGHGALLHVQRIKLALGAGHEQTMYARMDQHVDHHLPGAVVDALVFPKRCYQRGDYAMERTVDHGPMLSIPATMGIWNRRLTNCEPLSTVLKPNWRSKTSRLADVPCRAASFM